MGLSLPPARRGEPSTHAGCRRRNAKGEGPGWQAARTPCWRDRAPRDLWWGRESPFALGCGGTAGRAWGEDPAFSRLPRPLPRSDPSGSGGSAGPGQLPLWKPSERSPGRCQAAARRGSRPRSPEKTGRGAGDVWKKKIRRRVRFSFRKPQSVHVLKAWNQFNVAASPLPPPTPPPTTPRPLRPAAAAAKAAAAGRRHGARDGLGAARAPRPPRAHWLRRRRWLGAPGPSCGINGADRGLINLASRAAGFC